jgi:hypothetical protein
VWLIMEACAEFGPSKAKDVRFYCQVTLLALYKDSRSNSILRIQSFIR